MTPETVRLERDGRLGKIVLHRPPLNILDVPMLGELAAALDTVASDPRISAVMLTGEGRAFCAGVSVEDHTADRVEGMIGAFHEVVERLLAFESPVIAVVNGAALGGGCELALACDIVLVREGAKMGQPEVRLGVLPPAAAVLLPRLIGRQRALDVVLSGRTFEGADAVRMGLASQALPAEDFVAAAERYALEVASLSRPVLRLAKRAVREGATGSVSDAMRRVERLYLDDLMRLPDAREGLAAFMEKRTPVWEEARS